MKAHVMDPSYDNYFRVTGATNPAEAVAFARSTWPAVADQFCTIWEGEEDTPEMSVTSQGWYRCIPCICGEGHRYDVYPAEPHARGATYTYLVGPA